MSYTKLLFVLLALCIAFTLPNSFAQSKSDLRVMVLIPEEVMMRPEPEPEPEPETETSSDDEVIDPQGSGVIILPVPFFVPDPAAETEIMRALIEDGFRLVDVDQAELLKERTEIRAGATPEQIADIGNRFNADILITGEAFSEEDTVISGLSFFQARLEVQIVDLANGQILFSEAYTGPGSNVSPSVAAKDALQTVGTEAGQMIPDRLTSWIENTVATGRTFVVRTVGASGFSAYNTFLDDLRNAPGVSDVLSRQFDTAGSEAEVSFTGTQEELAILLEESLGLVITGLSAGEITAEFGE